jgi:hypothetical protein
MKSTHTLTTAEIRRVACPVCRVPPESPCQEPATGSQREHHHLNRAAVARNQKHRKPSGDDRLDAARRRVAARMFRP